MHIETKIINFLSLCKRKTTFYLILPFCDKELFVAYFHQSFVNISITRQIHHANVMTVQQKVIDTEIKELGFQSIITSFIRFKVDAN